MTRRSGGRWGRAVMACASHTGLCMWPLIGCVFSAVTHTLRGWLSWVWTWTDFSYYLLDIDSLFLFCTLNPDFHHNSDVPSSWSLGDALWLVLNSNTIILFLAFLAIRAGLWTFGGCEAIEWIYICPWLLAQSSWIPWNFRGDRYVFCSNEVTLGRLLDSFRIGVSHQ